MPSIEEYREVTRRAFHEYDSHNGGLRAHVSAAYVDWIMADERDLSPTEEMLCYTVIHSLVLQLWSTDRTNVLLPLLHSLTHEAQSFIISEYGLADESFDDPLITHGDDFKKWADELPDLSDLLEEGREDG